MSEDKRDYEKDLAVCEKATPGPVKWQKFGKSYYLTGQYGMRPIIFATIESDEWCHDNVHISNRDAERDRLIPLDSNHPDSRFVEMAWNALPWYIRRCMELENQLSEWQEGCHKADEEIKYLRTRNAELEKRAENAEAQAGKLEKQLSNAIEIYRMLDFRNRQQLDLLNAIYDRDKGQYWAWQLDPKDNHLESLTCPVLIPAEWLRNLLEEKETANAELQAQTVMMRGAMESIRDSLIMANDDSVDREAWAQLALEEIEKALSQTTQAGEKWVKMCKVVDVLSELTQACKKLPASDGRIIGLIPIIDRVEKALATLERSEVNDV